ncbi:MAG: tetratricopeptide repeat protein [Firmicutes bacterium]|nr:tetratricopeptide repeat protein [Bacillota bacterium]
MTHKATFFRTAVLALALLTGAGPWAAAAPQHSTWIEVRTPNFQIVSDAPEAKVQQLARDFELVRQVFLQAAPGLENRAALPLLVLAARNEKTLQSLLPEYWEGRRARPSAVYVGGPERNFVALRLDAPGRHPYHVIYHEYFHFLMRQNYPVLPLWLSEGLAEFWSHGTVRDDRITLGEPSPEHLALLRKQSLLPLEQLFAADSTSPLYNEEEKAGLFYAQSWLLVHYLMFGEGELAGRHRLDRLLELLRAGVASAEAHRQVFREPERLLRELKAYRHARFRDALVLSTPEGAARWPYPARALAAAEALAVRANFHVHTNRPVEARALIEQALQLDPRQPLAYEAMGYLHYAQGEPEEAADWFARAAELDSESCLAHYYLGRIEAESPRRGEQRWVRAEQALRRALTLNPAFAPAYGTLAQLFLRNYRELEEAQRLAERAVALEPGTFSYQATLARILLARGDPDAAHRIVERMRAGVRNEAEQQQLAELESALVNYQSQLARQQAARLPDQIARENSAPVTPATPTAQPPARPPAPPAGRRVQAEGIITEVVCSGRQMELRLDFGGLFLHLQTPDYEAIEYLASRWQPPPNFLPCQHLKNRRAGITYVVVQEKPFRGEIVSIEVRP